MFRHHYKKIILGSALSALVIVLFGSIRVGAQNVTIDPNLNVSPNVISFETTFPGEVNFRPLTVNLSSEFIQSPIHDDVEYRIVQRTKPRVDTESERDYCGVHPEDLTRCYPSLCPYLSKEPDGTPANDTGVPAFHDPTASSSIAYGRLAKSDNDTEDNWVIDLHTPCFRGQCDQDNPIPPQYQLDPALNGEVFGCDLVVEVERVSYSKNCPLCEVDQSGNPVVVDVSSNVTIDFNQDPPTYSGDPALLPYFSYDKASTTPSGWNAIFNLGGKGLHLKPGVTISTTPVGTGNSNFAPGIIVKSDCTLNADAGSKIIVSSDNKDGGNILLNIGNDVTINGLVQNEQKGSVKRPGNITIASWCGDIIEGRSGLVETVGRHYGVRDINILACDIGDIEINGLVMGRAAINSPSVISQPDINVAAFGGKVDVNADTPAPLYPNFSYNGSRKDLWGGLLSWIAGHATPGTVRMQAYGDITVRGHGRSDDDSFGAVSAKAFTGDPFGGVVDARSITGNISGFDRAFDVSGRNLNANPVTARINLAAAKSVFTSRPGADATFGPVVDASATGSQSKGGKNDIRGYQGGITNAIGSIISAFGSGTGATSGTNNLQSCAGVVDNGTITPIDSNPGDDIGSCSSSSPQPLWPDCSVFPGLSMP
ncbi:MAG: hypothetical protein A3J04_03500 [Candidatus Ryanbacteria bacterium RIFCSPLOWO2_02_FULL_47_14]|uniref:Uncharacterized protein n=2 Tax=Candidatus Ryaniibacteriota TaxID=1817914 RepID=A0A1G2H2N1_9BACT|nr:MAG: hypothetical protein A3J04_03500 [Candidatus Ryanbacteria bacterium RIFCSPLOWO2_02_FULL_47_14]